MTARYYVASPFMADGKFYRPGDIVELDDEQAARLRSCGVIGGIAPEVAMPEVPENAMRKPVRRAKRNGYSG